MDPFYGLKTQGLIAVLAGVLKVTLPKLLLAVAGLEHLINNNK